MSTTEQSLEVIGIVGCGLMGRGIAQIAVQGGMPVILHDADHFEGLFSRAHFYCPV
jgi:3-hydroxybutyryl-CoA dehydrogenase